MNRATHFALIAGSVCLLWLEAPRAWSVFAGDLQRVAFEGASGGAEATPPSPETFTEVRVAELGLSGLPQLYFALPPRTGTPSRR